MPRERAGQGCHGHGWQVLQTGEREIGEPPDGFTSTMAKRKQICSTIWWKSSANQQRDASKAKASLSCRKRDAANIRAQKP